MITNKYNYPQAIVNAVTNDPYDAGECDISVTRLIKPPQQVALVSQHWDELHDEDVSDRIWSLLGQASHTILERAAADDAVVEQRWFADVLGWTLSGQIDLLEGDTLTDFKVTSVWSVKEALAHGKTEWAEQLNVLKWLHDMNRANLYQGESITEIGTLQIVAICRDWRKNEALRYDDYPKQAELIEIPMWTDNERQAFVEKKIFEHQEARVGNWRPCTDSERWAKADTYAIMKEGRKSAVRVLDTREEAEKWLEANPQKGKISIELRKGSYTMCESYCAAAPFCQQYQDEP